MAAARSQAAQAPTSKRAFGPVQRFALLAGEQVGEFLGGAFDGVGGLEERGGPGVVAQGGPRRLGGRGGGDRPLEVSTVCTGASPTGWPVAGSRIVRLSSPEPG